MSARGDCHSDLRERGRNEDSLGYDARFFATKACRAAAKVHGSLAAGITFAEEQGQGPEELEKRDVLSSCP